MTPRRSAALRLASRKSATPCSRMIRAASSATAWRSRSARGLGLRLTAGPARRSIRRSIADTTPSPPSSPSNDAARASGTWPSRNASNTAPAAPTDVGWPVERLTHMRTTPGGSGSAVLGAVAQRLLHEGHPHRQRRPAAFLAFAERAFLVEADPGRRCDVAVEADEPRVAPVAGGAGLAGEVVAAERLGALRRAPLDHVQHDVGHHERVGRRDRLRRRGGAGAVDARDRRLRHEHLASLAVGHALDHVRRDEEAAVGEHREAARHLERRHLARAQREGQVRRRRLGAEAEAPRCGASRARCPWPAAGAPRPGSGSAPAPRAAAWARRSAC